MRGAVADWACRDVGEAREAGLPGVVELSDHGDLMTTFLGLPFPRMFMYGDQNASLSHLPRLAAAGVELAEIPQCGHFPMYSNPPVMWARIADFQGRVPDPWWWARDRPILRTR
ncbi:alpha/beta fold hydrolase [Streptomyces sp. BRA346]|uniref:alpha/beta fold hydrolase n=1 Tax=Streptomyces sp. BRA346 TaxID=2878199 RepID=UPI004063A9B1